MNVFAQMLACAGTLLVPAYANSVFYTPQVTAIHQDNWFFRYEPTIGWSGEIRNGNAGDLNLSWNFDNPTLIEGEIVPLTLLASVSLSSRIITPEIDSSGGHDELANFIGMRSALVTVSVGDQSGTSSFLEGQGSCTFPLVLNILAEVSADRLVALDRVFLSHSDVRPEELSVVDPNAAAAFNLTTFATLKIESVSFTSVPDSGGTAPLCIIAMLGLVIIRRKY